MKTLKLNNQKNIPALGLGTWKAEPGEVGAAVKKAIEVGYRHIDCAAIYGNEKEVGEGIQEGLKSTGCGREELFATSKLWNNAHRKENVRPALEKTLADLGLEYLDLYLIHWPIVFKDEVQFPESGKEYVPLKDVPVSETWEQMEKAVSDGLVKSIGVSNFSQKKLKDLISNSQIKPAVNQIELHPFLQQKGMLEFCNSQDIILTAYSPLGSKDRPESLRAKDEKPILENKVIAEIAQHHKASTAQVLIRWAVQRGTTVIPKSSNPKRIQENFDSLNLELTAEEMKKIGELDLHARYIDGSIFASEGSPYTLENIWDETE